MKNCFAIAVVIINLASLGCSSPSRQPAAYEYEPPEETRQHPSSYFMDRFNVPKERPARPVRGESFFFKHCTDGPGRSPHSATSYECDYEY